MIAPMGSEDRRYSRGYLPHIQLEGAAQFDTWRLADSLPASFLNELNEVVKCEPESQRRAMKYRQIERHLDAGFGHQFLRNGQLQAWFKRR